MKVFISYASRDEPLARKVAALLEAAGLEVWDDSREILPGDNSAAKVAQGLQGSDAMVVLLTPAALHSRWVRREIEYALGEKHYRRRLIPVLVSPPGEMPQEDIPWILQRLHMIKLTEHSSEKEGIEQIARALMAAA